MELHGPPASEKFVAVVSAGRLSGDVLQAGAKSISEIEKLMGELHAARDYLQSEGERLRRDTARYAHLTQSALSSVKMISESMENGVRPICQHPDRAASREYRRSYVGRRRQLAPILKVHQFMKLLRSTG
jgi:hypothetical protein